jgi:hypothetical protein
LLRPFGDEARDHLMLILHRMRVNAEVDDAVVVAAIQAFGSIGLRSTSDVLVIVRPLGQLVLHGMRPRQSVLLALGRALHAAHRNCKVAVGVILAQLVAEPLRLGRERRKHDLALKCGTLWALGTVLDFAKSHVSVIRDLLRRTRPALILCGCTETDSVMVFMRDEAQALLSKTMAAKLLQRIYAQPRYSWRGISCKVQGSARNTIHLKVDVLGCSSWTDAFRGFLSFSGPWLQANLLNTNWKFQLEERGTSAGSIRLRLTREHMICHFFPAEYWNGLRYSFLRSYTETMAYSGNRRVGGHQRQRRSGCGYLRSLGLL